MDGHVKVFYKSWDLIYSIIRNPVHAKEICDGELKKAEITPGVCPRNSTSPQNATSGEMGTSIWNSLTSFLKEYATGHNTSRIQDSALREALKQSIESGTLIDETEQK